MPNTIQVAMMSRITISLRKAGKLSESEPLPGRKAFLFGWKAPDNFWKRTWFATHISNELSFSRPVELTASRTTSMMVLHSTSSTAFPPSQDGEAFELQTLSIHVAEISRPLPAHVPPTTSNHQPGVGS